MTLSIYSETTLKDNQYVDRFWLAPPGLGIAQAKKERRGRRYKTREGARRALVAYTDHERRHRDES